MKNKKQLSFYVTGTDTEVGKTLVSCAILKALELNTQANHKGNKLTSAAMKPIASGCEKVNGQLKNSDALALQRNTSLALPYEVLNPYAFQPAIAPHIAANEVGVTLSSADLIKAYQKVLSYEADINIVEGAGGWFVPLNDKETLADFAEQLAAPVILVVAIRLGCINHALLSVKAIEASGLKLAGWVANSIISPATRSDESESRDLLNRDSENRDKENIATLKERIAAPLLADLPYFDESQEQDRITAAASYINVDKLLCNNS